MEDRRYLELAREAAFQQLEEDARRVSPRVMRLLDLVRAHLFEPDVGEAQLLSELGTDRERAASTAHDFLHQLGESPAQYIRTIRALGSSQLIGKTDLPFERIAELLEWPSLSALGKACRQLYGSSPGELRERARQARRHHPSLWLDPVPRASESLSDEERERFARRLAQKLGEWLTPDKVELLATGELQVDPLVFELMKEESN